MLSELVGSTGSVTGCDCSEHRLNITRNVLRKHGCDGNVRLFQCDAVRFSVLAPPPAPAEEELQTPLESRAKYGPQGPLKRLSGDGSRVEDWPITDVRRTYHVTGLKVSRHEKKHRFDLPALYWSNDHLLRVVGSVPLFCFLVLPSHACG